MLQYDFCMSWTKVKEKSCVALQPVMSVIIPYISIITYHVLSVSFLIVLQNVICCVVLFLLLINENSQTDHLEEEQQKNIWNDINHNKRKDTDGWQMKGKRKQQSVGTYSKV